MGNETRSKTCSRRVIAHPIMNAKLARDPSNRESHLFCCCDSCDDLFQRWNWWSGFQVGVGQCWLVARRKHPLENFSWLWTLTSRSIDLDLEAQIKYALAMQSVSTFRRHNLQWSQFLASVEGPQQATRTRTRTSFLVYLTDSSVSNRGGGKNPGGVSATSLPRIVCLLA